MKERPEILSHVVYRAAGGDSRAQRRLYDLFCQAMYAICVRMTGCSEDAKDILQESFLKAFRGLEKLRDKRQFAGWLKKIVVHECVRHLKQDVRWASTDLSNHDFYEGTDEGWMPGVEMDAIYVAIEGLPYGCRQIFMLYVMEDYSHKEIADLLSISESTSKSQYQRARGLLKKCLMQTSER